MRSALKFLPWQIAHTSIYHIEGWPFAPEEPSPPVMAGFVLVYVLVGIYVLSALISKRHRTPYDWAAGSTVIIDKDRFICLASFCMTVSGRSVAWLELRWEHLVSAEEEPLMKGKTLLMLAQS